MSVMGFTLNNMTLLAITLAVGIVIDDAIVVLENIFRYIEEELFAVSGGDRGHPRGGARGGDDAVAGRDLPADRLHERLRQAVHQPVRLDDGVRDPGVDAGQLHADADAQLAVPEAVRRGRDHKTKERGFFHWLDQWYTPGELGARSSRLIIAISVVTVLLTVPLNRMVGREFVPNEDMGDWTVHVDAPEGTSLEGTRRWRSSC